jgi:DNA-binding transcriptional MocR family regulator
VLSADRRAELLEGPRETGALVIEAAGLHVLLRLPAGQGPGRDLRDRREHGIMLEKAAWHRADPHTAPPTLLIGYGLVREDDLARGIESLGVSAKPWSAPLRDRP